MDKQTRQEIEKRTNERIEKSPKYWNNTYIKHQIDKRNNGETFNINDHIRAMVYSMLSAGGAWNQYEKDFDSDTGRINSVDKIFGDYSCSTAYDPSDLARALKCPSKQMEALVHNNIPMLMHFDNNGGIDNYYRNFINKDNTFKALIYTLSHTDSENKLLQLGEALIAEYLRNVGYDIAKPDRHICRILGSNCLGIYNSEKVPPFTALDIVAKIAEIANKGVAETDYIIWSFCAKGYGTICNKAYSKCNICKIKEYCKHS